MKILLGIHPAERHVTVSRLDRRHLFICTCGEKTIEPAGRPPGRIVRCDTCGTACKPYIVPALPDQHGIWIGGNGECDASVKADLIAAGFQCKGYCTKERDAQIWYTEKVDPAIVAEVNAVVIEAYGGEPIVYEKPSLTPEEARLLGMPVDADESPPSEDEIQDEEDEVERA